MDFATDFDSARISISQALISTIRSSTNVSAEDVSFYRSLDPSLGQAVDRQNARLLSLTERLLRRTSASTQASSISLPDAEAIDSKWKSLVDVTDTLLERADTCLDEYTGLIKRASPQNRPSSPRPVHHPTRKPQSFRAQNIPKPQLEFDVKPSNHTTAPFKPFLTSKPHAIVPYEESFAASPNGFGRDQYQHPYASEIEKYEFPTFVATQSEPLPYTEFNATQAEFVDTIDGVHRMLQELKQASIIAIDLEHHDTHSFVGIVSLMQISTRNHDWIVDTLKPWRRKLEVLNEVFADPTILKVLHGAQMDILWLQRDLGLYIVGLFDTHHAARSLGYAGGSLAFLLKKFVDFDAQKQYQTADWRLRPLPQEMFNYARSDTHFLLYIYDHMRNELIQKSDFSNPELNKLLDVQEKSKETALQRYEYDVYDENRGLGRGGWYSLLRKTPALLSKQQFGVFRKVHQWRDQVARQEDESPLQIMPNYALFNVARSLPNDIPSLLNCLHPVSQPIRLRSSDLLSVIQQANTDSINGPEMSEVMANVSEEIGQHWKSKQQAVESKPPVVEATEVTLEHPATDPTSIRTDASQFWGSTISAEAEKEPTSIASHLAFEATPGLPPVAAKAFIETTTANAHHSMTPPTNSPNISDASPLLGKRKAPGANDEDLSSPQDEPQTPESVSSESRETKFLEKLQRRAERKAAKNHAKAARTSNSNGVEAASHVVKDQPFDYESAPSILNAKPESGNAATTNDGKKGKKARQMPFDLYKKASDAKGGLGKSNVHGSGRSGTFR